MSIPNTTDKISYVISVMSIQSMIHPHSRMNESGRKKWGL